MSQEKQTIQCPECGEPKVVGVDGNPDHVFADCEACGTKAMWFPSSRGSA